MTDRQSAPFKFRLPAPTSITEQTVCYEVELPNEPLILEAFEGAVHLISNWTYWTKDEMQSAVKASNVFKALYQRLNAMPCVRCSPNNPPMLPPLEPGETKTLRLVVEAGEFNLLPIVLKANQSLTLIDWSGQWRDSQYHPEIPCSSNWETPEGFIIANAGGATADTFPTDALPDYPHMRLAMRVNNCGILTYHELSDPITFTVPASVDPGGVFVEFFGNCPLDVDGEVASGFLGYGMICLKAVVSDPNLCAQFFTDFSAPLPGNLDIVQGIIVDPSPIGEGDALKAIIDGVSTLQLRIDIALDNCTVRDFAFNYYKEDNIATFGSGLQWQLYDSNDVIITGGIAGLDGPANQTNPITIDAGSTPGCSRLRITCFTNLVSFGPNLYIDNVFIN